MERFWGLLERSVILQGVLTLVFSGVICYLIIIGRDVPEIVAYALATILGYYFGSKTQNEIALRYRKDR